MNYTNRNANIDLYFREIRSFKDLTKEEEITLFTRVSSGDRSAESEIFNKVAKLAVAVAKTYTCKSDLLEDLIQEANVGILDAIKKFDLTAGCRFTYYARWWMKAYISKYLDAIGIIRTTNPRLQSLARKIAEKFFKDNQRQISEYELLDELEAMGEVVTDVMSILPPEMMYIDENAGDSDDDKSEIGEFATVTASKSIFEQALEEDTIADLIGKRMARLTPREQELVKMKFGLGRDFEMDYQEISRKWNELHPEKTLSQERVRQIVVSAIKKMK